MSIGRGSRIKEFLTIRRNRNALLASEIVMVCFRFCGIDMDMVDLTPETVYAAVLRRQCDCILLKRDLH